MRHSRLALLIVLGLAVTLFAACGASGEPAPSIGLSDVNGANRSGSAGAPIRVGSKNFTEQLILGHMYAELLEANGIPVERHLNQGGTMETHQALISGSIDLYPEYTGTGLLVILREPTRSDSRAVYAIVSREYQRRFGVVWLDQAPMNNSQALTVRRSLAESEHLVSVSDLARISSRLTIAAPADFPQREDGLIGLRRAYGDLQFKEVKSVDPGIKYRVLLGGQADVLLAFGTDGQIDGYNLIVLQDDRGLWPPYHVAPVVLRRAIDSNPSLPRALNQLAPRLTDEAMRSLNWEVDGPDKRDPAGVAHRFLEREGLAKR